MDMNINELNPCPFCGGKARITAKDCEYGGHNGTGIKRRKFRVRAICNRCHATGQPVKTEFTKENVWTYIRGYRGENVKSAFDDAFKKATDLWNARSAIDSTESA